MSASTVSRGSLTTKLPLRVDHREDPAVHFSADDPNPCVSAPTDTPSSFESAFSTMRA